MCPVLVTYRKRLRPVLAMDLLKQFLESGNFKLLGQDGQSVLSYWSFCLFGFVNTLEAFVSFVISLIVVCG